MASTSKESDIPESEESLTLASKAIETENKVVSIGSNGEEHFEEEKDSEMQKIMAKREAIFKKAGVFK